MPRADLVQWSATFCRFSAGHGHVHNLCSHLPFYFWRLCCLQQRGLRNENLIGSVSNIETRNRGMGCTMALLNDITAYSVATYQNRQAQDQWAKEC
jgi:hypothetical protein